MPSTTGWPAAMRRATLARTSSLTGRERQPEARSSARVEGRVEERDAIDKTYLCPHAATLALGKNKLRGGLVMADRARHGDYGFGHGDQRSSMRPGSPGRSGGSARSD